VSRPQDDADDPHVDAGTKPVEASASRLRITGRVQGVGYRDWLLQAACRLELTGWVRNRRDGSVEAHVQGPTAALERLAGQCLQGPPAARVERVEVTPTDLENLSGFHRRGTD
jgi:acylphosphatase